MDNISSKLSQNIRQKAHELHKITLAIKSSLPTDCHTHIEVAGVSENQLIILTDSPVWQTRLRMLSQSMLETLHQQTGLKLTRVSFKVTPAQRVKAKEKPCPRTLSQVSASIINQTASTISDPDLRDAMLRLSRKSK